MFRWVLAGAKIVMRKGAVAAKHDVPLALGHTSFARCQASWVMPHRQATVLITMPAAPNQQNRSSQTAAKRKPAPKRMPHATFASHLLSDIAPELALHWTASEATEAPQDQKFIPSTLYRGLISTMLRAASRHDRDATYNALCTTLTLPVQSPPAPLGFSPDVNLATIAEVMGDLATSAVRDEPLLPSSAALTHFSDAGPGAGDAAEYQTASGEHRVAFAEHKESLPDVRTLNLASTLHYLAEIIEAHGPTAQLLSDAVSRNVSTWLSPFTDVLPNTVCALNSELREALRRIYAAYMLTRNPVERKNILTRLASSLMLLLTDTDSLSLYIETIGDPQMKFAACRICLTQRFGVTDDVTNRFSLSTLKNCYLKIRPVPGRKNAAVPALLSGLIMGWYETVSEKDLCFHPTGSQSVAYQVHNYLKDMNALRGNIVKAFRPSPKDRATFKTALMNIGNEIIDANQPNMI